MRIPLLLATCWALTNFAGAQVLSEDFDSGAWPPAGWTVLDNLGNGTWDTSSTFNHGNLAGSGECAAFDSDNYGTVDVDGELISPSIVIPSGGYFLEFDHYFNHLGPEFGDVDISVNGGAWQNLVSFSADTNGLVSLDLAAYAVSDDFGVFFEANNALNGGNGLFLGDGLRCAGGGLVRLTPPVLATGNTVTMTTSVQSSGDAAAGTTKYYQYWFLTPGGPCATGANLTNGYEIVWGP